MKLVHNQSEIPMNNKHSLLAIVLGALLAGCASEPSTQLEITPPSNSDVCCSDFSQYPFAQLRDNEEIKFDIDLASPVGAFETGNSHFAAFRFSDRSGDVTVSISSLMVDDNVFAPEVLILDENFAVVRTIKLDEFKVLPSDAFTRTRYVAKFKANAAKTPYFLIYTPAMRLGESVKVDHPAKVRAKEFGEVMPMVTDPVYTYQIGGDIEIEVETLKLRPFRATAPVAAPAVAAKQNAAKPKPAIQVQPDTQSYYFNAIETAVASGDIPKALSLLDEAKALNIKGAQEVFVKAVNAK